MKLILGFLLTALKWVARPISMIKDPSEEAKYVLLDDVQKSIELNYHLWLSLSRQYRMIARIKRFSSLYDFNMRVKTVMSDYLELNGFDLKAANPFLHLINVKAMTKEQIITLHGDMTECVDIRLIPRMVSVIITYNFFKKYKERAGELFTNAEENMKQLVTENRLPGRFSWNKSVPKGEREKHQVDPTFLDDYGNASNSAQSIQAVQPIAEADSNIRQEELLEADQSK